MFLLNEHKESKNEILRLIQNASNISIVPHFNPDGDAVGSALALYQTLKKINANTNIIATNSFPTFLRWMPQVEQICYADTEKQKASKILNESSLIFCVDFNNLDRIPSLKSNIEYANAKKVLIDHHPDPSNDFDYILSNTNSSSTCELIYEFIELLELTNYLDKDIATCLYSGIITDTGSFNYNSSNPNTFRVVTELLKLQINKDEIFDKIYNNFSENRLRLLGYVLNKKMKIIENCSTAYISLSSAELKEYESKNGDTEGFVNYPLSVKDIQFSAIFIEKNDCIKISFRSRDKFAVNEFAKKYFNGGGHKNAAGGKYFDSFENTIQKFISLVEQHKDEINA